MPPRVPHRNSLAKTLPKLMSSLQFYWFLGHAAAIILFLAYFVFSFLSTRRSSTYYRYALVSELISYGIVIKQVHFKSRLTPKAQVLKDDNFQYFILGATFFISSFKIGPISGALYPFVIYSFFHTITYFQANVLESLPITLQTQASINARISHVSTNFNQQALFIASSSEVMLFSYFLMGLPGCFFRLFRDPIYVVVHLLTFMMVVVFVKLRYNDSQYTRAAVQQFDARITQFLANPIVPPQLAALYNVSFKNAIVRYVGPIKVPVSAPAKKSQ